jgi:hypothetical protein
MTETEWQECADPAGMLDFLRGKVSPRKQRLFACACCRRIESFLVDQRSRRLIEVSEQFADGRATARRLQSAWDSADEAEQGIHHRDGSNVEQRSAQAVMHLGVNLDLAEALGMAVETMGEAARNAAYETNWRTPGKDHAQRQAADHAAYVAGASVELAKQAALLRELIGNPFRRVVVAPEWLAWSDGTVRKLAGGVYEAQGFERMGILGDALEEAGCSDDAILAHCRAETDHVRGCWLVDILTGRD